MSLIIYGEKRISPIVQKLALSRVTYLAEKAINEAVIEQITENGVEYDTFVTLVTNTNGEVTALKTNMLNVNHFKSDVSVRVIEKLKAIDTSELSIPLGNIINAELLSGRGPRLRVRLVPTGSAQTDVFSKFSSAGINQTLHQIMVEVKASVSVLLPYTNTSTTVSSLVSIAETVIVGNVPQSYTYLEDTGQSAYDLWGNFNSNG
jgi:sporulation protein YunB